MNKRKIPPQFSDIKDEDIARAIMEIQAKLARIVIYYLKEDHTHEMYRGTWGEPLVVITVSNLLDSVMSVLKIDPEAKSY